MEIRYRLGKQRRIEIGKLILEFSERCGKAPELRGILRRLKRHGVLDKPVSPEAAAVRSAVIRLPFSCRNDRQRSAPVIPALCGEFFSYVVGHKGYVVHEPVNVAEDAGIYLLKYVSDRRKAAAVEPQAVRVVYMPAPVRLGMDKATLKREM